MLQNLSKNSTNISIFCKTLTDEIFEDLRFVQLMNMLISRDDLYKYTYCFYCDSASLKNNLFIPIFHTSYLTSNINNVLIKDVDDLWLLDIFSHNNFYILKDQVINDYDFTKHNIKIINHISELRSIE